MHVVTTESLRDLLGITSQISDSDSSRPVGADMLKAPQSHRLKDASRVFNIPHLEMFMARHRYQQHKFQGPVNDTAPRQSLEQPAARLPGPAKPRTSNQDDAPGCSAGPASHASLPRPEPWQPRAQLQCFLSVVKSDGCPEDAAGGLPLGAALRARAGGVFPDRCCLRAARPPPCAPAKSRTPFLTHSFAPSVIRPRGTMFADAVVMSHR